MPYVPSTTVLVCTGVPFDSTYRDVRLFESEGEQIAYFKSKAKYTCETYSYQRVNSSVAEPRGPLTCRVKILADDIYDCNYIAFQNENFGSKWFYAFVRQMNYINPNCTEIVYELDIWNTWLFDWTFLPSYVEREHTNNDVRYANQQVEPIQIQGTFCQQYQEWIFRPPYNIIVATATDPDTIEIEETDWGMKTVNWGGGVGEIKDNVYSGLKYTTCRTAEEVNQIIDSFAIENAVDRIVAIFMSPYSFDDSGWHNQELNLNAPPMSVSGYAPRNMKCLQWPYCYLRVTNLSDEVKDYPYEGFCAYGVNPETGAIEVDQQPPRFIANAAQSYPASLVVMPMLYFGLSGHADPPGDLDNAIELRVFPDCSWVSNSFYSTAVKSALGAITKTINLAGSLANAGITASSGRPTKVAQAAQQTISAGTDYVSSAVQGTADLIGSFLNPYQLGGKASNITSGMYLGKVGFEFKNMMLLPEQMMKLDSFFDRYGYATNMMKVPNMRGRANWNYVKTRECTIVGSLPVQAMNRLRRIFDDGVWIWHTDAVGNYALTNEIIGGENNG